jgi:hypothetical protein
MTEGGGIFLIIQGKNPGEMAPESTLCNNSIVSNTASNGGGLYVSGGRFSTIRLSGDVITGNVAEYGGGIWMIINATLTNAIIADNHAFVSGSGLYLKSGSYHLVHATLARNSGGDGSGMYVREYPWPLPDYSAVALTNTILVSHTVGISVTGGNSITVDGVLWFNTPLTISQMTTATVTVRNQNTGDPHFAADGYHILPGSAAIDAGVDAGVRTDIDNQPRPFQAADLGADEYWPPGMLKYVYLPFVLKNGP